MSNSKILVLGYYDKYNLGDETYRHVFPKIFPNKELVFRNPHELAPSDLNNLELIVCGGGDIINDWFNEAFEKVFKNIRCKVYAISIGITYPSTINKKYLGHYDRMYVRHNEYANELAGVLGSKNVFHIPDLAFLLDHQTISTASSAPIIGVFMATRMYSIVDSLTKCLVKLSSNYQIVFYPFNVSTEEHEGDIFFTREQFPMYTTDTTTRTVEEMQRCIGNLHLAICVRYHSHILSIIENTPFVSLALTPKSQILMKDHGYINNVAKTPEEIDSAIDYALSHREELIEKNKQVYNDCQSILQSLKIIKPQTIDEITTEANQLITAGHSAEVVAGNILHSLTGSVKNKYTYGFVNNIRENKHDMREMVKWVRNDHLENKNKNGGIGIQMFQDPEEFANVHRSGWYYVVSMLASLQNKRGITCDVYVDGTFLWNETVYLQKGILPYKKLWIGFIHHTPRGGFNDLNRIISKNSFQLSLKQCKGLITLSEYTREWLQSKLGGIRVYTLKHPTETVPISARFNIFDFAIKPSIIQIGAWLRDTYAIYRLKLPWAKKFVLSGPNMTNYIHPPKISLRDGSKCIPGVCNIHSKFNHTFGNDYCICNGNSTDISTVHPGICRQDYGNLNVCILFLLNWLWKQNVLKLPNLITVIENGVGCGCGTSSEANFKTVNDIINSNYNSVQTISTVSNEEYDSILSKTTVFLRLEDASGVNTVIECIMRNTPIIINKLPAVVEYLGPNYPLYYDEVSEVSKFTVDDISKANKYLAKMDKQSIQIDSFLSGMRKILSNIPQ
jgi:polysaccharide pyruvyl transferase WcaK-like protein